MIKCPKCKELIGPSAPVYKASRGFIGVDGVFYEDESVILHIECSYDYTINPFDVLEDKIRNS
tara:strand:- start:280 stop:468 length:189 start_codon:yes stop_codon:yes gene_type:complete